MKRTLIYIALGLLAVMTLFPLLYMVTNSFMGAEEFGRYYGKLSEGLSGRNPLHLIPEWITMDGYHEILIARPHYLMKFWVSMFISLTIMAGQVVVSCFSGYGFSQFEFKYKKTLFYLIIILMMMPYQVTLVSNYIVLDGLGLIGSYASLIIPGVFSTFGVFLITQVFSSMPRDIIEAAKIDGAGHFRILFRIVVPYNKSGIISLVILNFIDNWNMVEQPLVFLKDHYKYPLSVFLTYINEADLGLGFACGVLAALPVIFLFLFFKEDLARGIEYSNLK